MHGNILQLIFDFPRERKNLYRESRSLDHRRRGEKERQDKKKKATGKLAQHCQPHTQLAAYVPQTETAHLCLIADFLHSNPISSSATNPAAPHRSFDEVASYAVRLCITTVRGAARHVWQQQRVSKTQEERCTLSRSYFKKPCGDTCGLPRGFSMGCNRSLAKPGVTSPEGSTTATPNAATIPNPSIPNTAAIPNAATSRAPQNIFI